VVFRPRHPDPHTVAEAPDQATLDQLLPAAPDRTETRKW
jgi:hypothetical protein